MPRRSKGGTSSPRTIVIGGGMTGLAAMRALGRRGIEVTLVTDEPDDLALSSRWCSAAHVLHEISANGEALVGLLEGRAASLRGSVLLPTQDEALEGLARHRDLLARSYQVAAPPLEVLRPILSKALTYEAAEALGIDVARVYGLAEPSILTRDDIVYPVVVKPTDSRPFVRRFGLKLFVARNHAELARAIADLSASGLHAQVLDHIPGPDHLLYHYVVYIDARGEPTGEHTMHKLRASPPFYGVSRVVESANAPALREPTLEFLRSIGWRGIAEAGYKLDPRDGRFRLLEINGRCFSQQSFSARCGIDYAHLAWSEAATGECPRASDNGWPGVWIDAHDDLYYGLFHRRIERLGIREYLAPYLRPKVHAVWSPSDPRPSIARWRKTLRRTFAASLDGDARANLRAGVQAMPS